MKDQMDSLFLAVRNQDAALGNQFMRCDVWRTFEQLISAHVHE